MKYRPYTADEDAIIRRYAAGGTGVIKQHLPLRSVGSLLCRASRLEIPVGRQIGRSGTDEHAGTISASASLRDRILAYEAAIARLHRVPLGEARAIAIYGAPAISRFSRITSTKGQDHVGR